MAKTLRQIVSTLWDVKKHTQKLATAATFVKNDQENGSAIKCLQTFT